MATLKKRVFLVILIFLVLVNISFAARIDATLGSTTYGPQRGLNGSFTLDINQLPNNTKLILELNGESREHDLLCTDITPATYSILQPEISSPVIQFESAGTNTEYAFDINTLSTTTPSTLSLESVLLEIKGSQKTSYPTSPTLDLNIDGKLEWEYIGPLITENGNIKYIEIPPNYLFNSIPYSGANLEIRGNKRTEYCEKIALPLSRSYKISAYVKTINQNGKLRARIRGGSGYNSILQGKDASGNTINAECSIEDTSSQSSNFVWKSCQISNENLRFIKEQNEEYLICVYSDAAEPDIPYYYIAFQLESAINKGYICTSTCSADPGYKDYFIFAYYGDYKREFDAIESISSDILKVSMITCKNAVKYNNLIHCIFPLEFTSKTDGKLEILQSSIKYPGVTINNPISKIAYIPATLTCSEKWQYYFDMDFPDLKTPKEKGDYKLNIKLKYKETIYESKSLDLKVVSVPTIIFDMPTQANVNLPLQFNISVHGDEPLTYYWDFGDNKNSTEKNPVHTFASVGDYDVILTVTDKNGMQEIANITISAVSVKDALSTMLNTTRTALTQVSSEFISATGSVKDVIAILNLNSLLTYLDFNLTKYETEFKQTSESTTKTDAAKEQEYGVILQGLLALRKSIPSKINVLSISYDSKLNSYMEIPDDLFAFGLSSSDISSSKEEIFSLQNNLDVKSDAYSVDIGYLFGNKDDFRLIKKIITVSGATQNLSLVEYIPKAASQNIRDTDILTPNFIIIEADPILKWPVSSSMQILYKLPAGALDILSETRTFLFSGTISEKGFAGEPECGDGVCSPLEEGWCNIDCKPKYPWLFIIFLILVIAGGIYYINFYKGRWNFRELANLISVKLAKKRLFTNKQDLINLQKYIQASLSRGMKESQVKEILLKKGWSNKQINYVISQTKK